MAVFRGAETCMSPRRYPGKQEMHRQMPTWNCQVRDRLHAAGTLNERGDTAMARVMRNAG